MTGTTRLARGSVAVMAALLLTAVPALPGAAATTTSPDWWWKTYSIDQVHAEGWTGKGIKIAVIDEQINSQAPALQGTNLTVAKGALCDGPDTTPDTTDFNEGSVHGTNITSLLIGNGKSDSGVRGIAPDAQVTFYGAYASGKQVCGSTDERQAGATANDLAARADLSTFGAGVQRAVDDGADIITTSVGSPEWEMDRIALANAIAKGVIVVGATANPATITSPNDTFHLNGIVAAAAVDRTGELQPAKGSEAIADTTVVAAGVDIRATASMSSWDAPNVTTTGSSNAAPIVAGMLAIAKQRYPSATGNQLIQSLITNTGPTAHPLSHTDDGYGYGPAWLTSLLANDPSIYDDQNPLFSKSLGAPTMEQVNEARQRGYALPEQARSADQYENGSTDSKNVPSPFSGLTVAVIVTLGLMIAAGIVTFIIFAARRSHRKGAA